MNCGLCDGPWYPHCGRLRQCGGSLEFRPRSDGSYVDASGKRRKGGPTKIRSDRRPAR